MSQPRVSVLNAPLPFLRPDVCFGVDASDQQEIRKLFDDYLRMYALRDDRLTTHFSEDFSGFTGGGDFLVKDRQEWIAITRQDFAQVKDPIRIELKDLAIQLLADTVAVATGFFTIHLPIKDHILSRETARLVLIFRKEPGAWKISHSSISIPYYLVRKGEVYPLKELVDRNQFLKELVVERTAQLFKANEDLRHTNEELARKMADYKQAQDALQRSEELYRSILTASPDDITITDLEGRILMASPMALKMFRASGNDKFLGRPVTDFITPSDRKRALSQIALKSQGVQTGTNEYHALRLDGGIFDIEVNSDFIRDALGSPTGIVFIVRDITERKQMEVDKANLEAINRQLQKAESLGRMAGAIAHTFNNQLAAVIGNLEMAAADLPKTEEAVKCLDAALQSAWAAAAVSGQMLTYLGQSFVERKPIDLSEACRGSLPIFRAAMPGKIVLETDLPSPGPVILANVDQLQQVLTNLITNAWEAVGEVRGTIHLAVKTVSRSEIPVANCYPTLWKPQDCAYACLELADTGCGIAGKDIENVFDPFFTSKFTGRGLGLAVVMGIVRTHAGAVAVESQLGRGSTFSVFLPLLAEVVPERPDNASQPGTLDHEGTVLLVEDEEMVRQMASAILKRLGFTVLEAKDGVQAVEVFRERHDEIRCVLCDLTMPRMDGWETLAALRKIEPHIPVVLASGYSQSQVMSGDRSDWPHVFLGKPYTLKAISEAIARAMINQKK
jgi:PAS domain S-box-containing protein